MRVPINARGADWEMAAQDSVELGMYDPRMWKVLAGLVAALVLVAGWRWIKISFATALVAVGIDWPAMNDGDRLNAAIGFVVGIASVAIAWFAYQISAKQNRYIEEERAKRAVFQITGPNVFSSKLGSYPLWVTNTGRRASGGYCYLGVPHRIRSQVTVVSEDGFRQVAVNSNADVKDNPSDDPRYSHFYDDYELLKFEATSEISPFDRRLFATVGISLREEDRDLFRRTFLWFTQTPDARYPEKGIRKILCANVNEHWIKYGRSEVQKAAEEFYDNTVDISARTKPTP